MNDVVKFEFEKKEVRSFWIDNEAWIVLSDICKILDLTKPSRVAQTLDDDEVKQINSEIDVEDLPRKAA